MEDYRLEQSGQEVQHILNGAAMQTDLTAENERAELAEQTLQGNIDAEALARENADGVLQGHIDDEETRAKAAEKQNADDIDAIEEKIPTQASSSNQLADKDYVEDLVSTSSATFRGTFNLVSDLHLTVDASYADIAAALFNAILGADNNDYAFVQIPTSVDTPTEIARIEKYKFNGSVWGFEYVLNNSGFTAAQWAAINSGITSALVTKLGALPSAADLAAALLAKQDKLTFDQAPTPSSTNPVTSGGVYTAIDDEKGARVNADAALQQAIEAILALIPSAATALNQLADKAFVNSSIATATATFRGTFNLVSDLQLTVDATHADIAAALLNAISTADNNDYAFVQIPTSVDTPTEIRVTERYKFNGTAWQYEYDLNNSGFTAAQWAAINSGITTLLVTKLSNLPNATELATLFAGKQNTLTFDNAPVSGSDNPVKSGGLYDLFAAIDAKMPTGASANNKLVAEDRLAAYVGGIIGALDATFDLTSTDGHVTLRMTQTDGVIASLQILTYDIASASALATLGGQVSTNASDIAALQALYNALQQSAPQVIEPTDTWPVASPSDTVIYRVIDRVNTPPQYYSDYMFKADDLTTPVLMATYNNAIDAEPTYQSHNLVESGGVALMKKSLDGIDINLSQQDNIVTLADGDRITITIEADSEYDTYEVYAYRTFPSDFEGLGEASKNAPLTVDLNESFSVLRLYNPTLGTIHATLTICNETNLRDVAKNMEQLNGEVETLNDNVFPVKLGEGNAQGTIIGPFRQGEIFRLDGISGTGVVNLYVTNDMSNFVDLGSVEVAGESMSVALPDNYAVIRITTEGMSWKLYKLNGIQVDLNELQDFKDRVDLPVIRALILGDSYSAGGGAWAPAMMKKLPTGSSFISLAVSSASLRDHYTDRVTYPYTSRPVSTDNKGNHNTLACQIQKLKRLMAGTDLDEGETAIYQTADSYPNVIIIAGGKNDNADAANIVETYTSQINKVAENVYCKRTENDEATLGDVIIKTPVNEVNRTCFAGAYRYLVDELLELFPNACIYFVTISPLGYRMGNVDLIGDAYKIVEQQRLCADLLNTTLIDWFRDGQINLIENYPQGDGTQQNPYVWGECTLPNRDTNDQLHPNARGGNKYGQCVANTILKTFIDKG